MSRLSYAGVIRVRFNGFTGDSISAQRLPEAVLILGPLGRGARETSRGRCLCWSYGQALASGKPPMRPETLAQEPVIASTE